MLLNLNKSVSSSYGHLAIVFFVMTTILTVVRGIFHDIFGDEYLTYLGPAVAPLGIFFFYFMVRLIKNLGVSEGFVNMILAFLACAVVLRLTTVLIFTDAQLKLYGIIASSVMLLLMQATCVYFMSHNLFIQENPIKEKLWASVCVYFMIGATFGTVYALLLSIDPVGLGIAVAKPQEIYVLGMVYSLNVISGLDPIYEHASETVRMTAILESIFIMLFMVILIGRLLGSKE